MSNTNAELSVDVSRPVVYPETMYALPEAFFDVRYIGIESGEAKKVVCSANFPRVSVACSAEAMRRVIDSDGSSKGLGRATRRYLEGHNAIDYGKRAASYGFLSVLCVKQLWRTGTAKKLPKVLLGKTYSMLLSGVQMKLSKDCDRSTFASMMLSVNSCVLNISVTYMSFRTRSFQ